MTGKAHVPSALPNQHRQRAVPIVARAHRLAYIERAVALGDEGALKQLLRALAPDMVRVIRTVLGRRHQHPEAVDRLLQVSILDVVGVLGQFRNDGSVAAFALAIAFRRALAARRHHGEELAVAESAGPAAIEPEPFPEMESRHAAVADLLIRLPQEQAEALGLRLVVGLAVDEIARATRAPAITVRGRLRVAKQSLQQTLERDPAPPSSWR